MSLEMDYDTLRREIGRFLGIGRSYSVWTADQAQDVDDIIAAGLRAFYWPPIPEAVGWSFLEDFGEVQFTPGKSLYALPEDFLGMLGSLTYTENSGQRVIEEIPDSKMRALYSKGNASGPPVYFSTRTIKGTYALVLYPNPDQQYTVQFPYSFRPGTISSSSPTPLGGPPHAETILESCLAAAEKTLDDTEQVHAKRFAERLVASLKYDKESK